MMKRKILIGLLLAMCVVPLSAQRVMRTLIHMEKLQRNGDHLQAMDTAVYVLTIDADNRIAKQFVYEHWDKTMRETNQQLSALSDANDLAQSQQRLHIYKQLDEIHTNLSHISLPLYGPNERWVWQPEVGYYTGLYDSERMRLYNMLLNAAEEALSDYDTDLAKAHYAYILDNLLIEDEKESNVQSLVQYVNTRVNELSQSTKIYELIVAYYLTDISLWLQPEQDAITSLKPTIQQHISERYAQEAEILQAKGDTVRAHEYRLTAQDWQVTTIEED